MIMLKLRKIKLLRRDQAKGIQDVLRKKIILLKHDIDKPDFGRN